MYEKMENRTLLICASDLKKGQKIARALKKTGMSTVSVVTDESEIRNHYKSGMIVVFECPYNGKEICAVSPESSASECLSHLKKQSSLAGQVLSIKSWFLREYRIHIPALIWADCKSKEGFAALGIVTPDTKKRDLILAVALACERAEVRNQSFSETKQAWDILGSLPDAVIATDESGEVIYSNPSASRLTGKSDRELLFRSITDILHFSTEPENSHFRSVIHATLTEKRNYHTEDIGTAESSQGKQTRVSLSVFPLTEESSRKGFLFVFSDITVWKTAEERLRLASKVIETTSEGIIITDPRRQIVVLNEAYCRMTGYSQKDLLGQDTSRIFAYSEYSPNYFVNLIKTLIESGQWTGEAMLLRKNGDVFPASVHMSVIRNEAGKITNFVGMVTDITERKRNEEKLRFLANHDPLTGSANRNLFYERLSHSVKLAARNGNRIAVLFMDLDHFKKINDSLGHHVGDLLLKEASERIRRCLRETDTLARLGGDEFTVLLESIQGQESTIPTVQRIIQALNEPFQLDNHVLYISSSIGISVYPEHGVLPEVLMKHADIAMYNAKSNGRNQYCIFRHDLVTR